METGTEGARALPPGNRPAEYFPLQKQSHGAGPALFRWGTDFGNGASDRRVFQVDREFGRFRDNIFACRARGLSRYYAETNGAGGISASALRFIAGRLCAEYPALFRLQAADDALVLQCLLTGEHLYFDAGMRLLKAAPAMPVPCRSALDALACQVPEDLAVIRRTTSGNELSAVHVCCPNGWPPADRVGMDFTAIHAPVPGFGQANPKPQALVDALIDRGPVVRFAWGIAPHAELDRHPLTNHGPCGEYYLRVERQTLHGFAAEDEALFTIRTCLYPLLDIAARPRQRTLLAANIKNMPDEVLGYKGLAGCRREVLSILEGDTAA